MLIGHQKQWQFLINAAKVNKLPHAFLFSGQAGLGKRTLAVEFIKWLNCQNANSANTPCQNCKNCKDIELNRYPDLIFISPESKEIKIAQIRGLKWALSLKPYMSLFKTAIIDEAHSMNQEAQNSLLKTLEEPKGVALLILTTEHPEQLFQTILSRTQKIKFFPVPAGEIKNYILKEGADKETATALAELALGRPGVAINFLKNADKLKFQQKTIRDFTKMAQSPLALRFQYAKDLAEDYQNLKDALECWQNYLRGILLEKICAKKPKEPAAFLNNYPISKLKNIIQLE